MDALEEAPVCYMPTGIADIDDYLYKANLIAADSRLAATICWLNRTGKTAVSNGQPVSLAVETIVPLLETDMKNGMKLKSEGELLKKAARLRYHWLRPLKLRKFLKALKLAELNIPASIDASKKAPLAELTEEPARPQHVCSGKQTRNIR